MRYCVDQDTVQGVISLCLGRLIRALDLCDVAGPVVGVSGRDGKTCARCFGDGLFPIAVIVSGGGDMAEWIGHAGEIADAVIGESRRCGGYGRGDLPQILIIINFGDNAGWSFDRVRVTCRLDKGRGVGAIAGSIGVSDRLVRIRVHDPRGCEDPIVSVVGVAGALAELVLFPQLVAKLIVTESLIGVIRMRDFCDQAATGAGRSSRVSVVLIGF